MYTYYHHLPIQDWSLTHSRSYLAAPANRINTHAGQATHPGTPTLPLLGNTQHALSSRAPSSLLAGATIACAALAGLPFRSRMFPIASFTSYWTVRNNF